MKKNNVLIVSFANMDEKSGNFHEPLALFALPNESIEESVESLRWTIAIHHNGSFFESYQETLSELDARKDELAQFIEGKSEYFEIDDARYYIKALPFEPGQENPMDLAKLRPGKMLYIRFDADGNETAVFAEDPGFEVVTRFVHFFKASNPQTLTLFHFMPFVIDGEYGYMINPKHERVGSLLKYAKPMAGFFYFVIDSDGKGYIVDVNGRKVTEIPTKIDFDNPGYNGYIPFMEGDKWGFIHADSATKSPVVFDGICPVEIGEAVRVKKDGEWGFLTETFDFISESAIEEDDSLTDDIYWYGDE